ncbi:hypothetical protein A3N46_11235 [Enterobacter asburiae]|nr:hypothetical protein A3N46_11235 [Enterobacter asburiae]
MLALCYVGLRFIHFGALMLVFGNALYSVWFAPSSLHRLLSRRFQSQQKVAALGKVRISRSFLPKLTR